VECTFISITFFPLFSSFFTLRKFTPYSSHLPPHLICGVLLTEFTEEAFPQAFWRPIFLSDHRHRKDEMMLPMLLKERKNESVISAFN
jgi:hypothetical protein